LYYAAWFSLVVPFLWFYALYLLLNAAFGEGPLGERGRRHLLVGGSILAIGFFVVPLLVLLV
jgi:hypothetical protein